MFTELFDFMPLIALIEDQVRAKRCTVASQRASSLRTQQRAYSAAASVLGAGAAPATAP